MGAVDLDVHCSMVGATIHVMGISTYHDDFQETIVKYLILPNQIIMTVFQQVDINCLEEDVPFYKS